MKHFLSVIVASIIAFVMMFSTATAEETDFSAYEIRDRFTPVEVYMLHGNNAVADTWSDRYGDIFLDWHNTWFQNGQILREVAYNPLGNQFYEPVPRLDGTCGILEILVIKDHDEPDQQENWIRVTLYDWDENGLVNPRMITEGFVDVENTYGGFTIRDIKSKELTVYDGMGNNCCALSNVENKPIHLAFDRTGSIWLMTVKYTNGFMNSNYTLHCFREGTLQWEQKLDEGTAFYPDQQGGLYCVMRLGSGLYPTIGITHLNNAGQEDLRKSLSADRVVLGCNVATNPETGEIYLAGRAVANSRGIYGVYRITLDQDWNIKDLDVRCMDYYHDPSLRVLINLDNDFYVHSNGIDEDAQGGINPVIVPFEKLEKMDNLGIRIK